MIGCFALRPSKLFPSTSIPRTSGPRFDSRVCPSMSGSIAEIRSVATIQFSSLPKVGETTQYFRSGCSAIARFAGIVQGVVVQIIKLRGLLVGKLNFFASDSGIGNLTQIEGEICSLYSISASAKAVSKGIDQ